MHQRQHREQVERAQLGQCPASGRTRRVRRQVPEGREDHVYLVTAVLPTPEMHNTRKARAIAADSRDMRGGNGILLGYQVAWHMADLEAIHASSRAPRPCRC